jgi:Glycosyl transferase family 2/Glycosyltransferase 61/Methyltransferase domain
VSQTSDVGRLLHFDDVVVSPFTDLLAMPYGRPYHRGGPDWPDWDHQVEARHCTLGEVRDTRPEPASDPTPLAGTYAWGGPVVRHFGHQIADFSMRLMPTLLQWPESTFLFAAEPGLAINTLADTSRFFREILAWFGIPESRARIVTTPLRVEHLVVAAQAEQITRDARPDTGPTAAHLDAMDELVMRRLGPMHGEGTLYVSRAAQHARMAGEAYLEERLRASGVTVMRPELFSLEEQLRAYAGAERLIFAQGSAVHGVQLLGRHLGHVAVIQRDPTWLTVRHCVEPRAASFRYVDASLGIVYGADVVGRPAAYRGVTVLDERILLDRLATFGVDLRAGWESGTYETARDADVIEWVDREMATPQGEVPETPVYVNESLDTTHLQHLGTRLARQSAPVSSRSMAGRATGRRRRWQARLVRGFGHLTTSGRAPGFVRRNALVRSLFGNPLFDADWYRANYPDVPTGRGRAYRHFLRHGARESRQPNAFFDTDRYLRHNPDALLLSVDPLDHYRLIGAPRGDDPGRHFSTSWYLSANPDVAASGMNPLEHYLHKGIAERRVRSGPLAAAEADREPVATPWSARRVNALAAALDATSYVEIGVANGTTFSAVHIKHRTGVDPNFGFDHLAATNPTTRLVPITSDQFFAGLPASQMFDIYFIDGLHTFEQTYRDLLNALAHAHPRSAFLIDDTVPVDEHSALPVQADALRARRLAGSTEGSWHGDTYKVVFAIHDLHPELDYRTITGSGNPQTLVWRSPGVAQRTARIGSHDGIAALTYADLQANLDVLQSASEMAALETCARILSPGRRRAVPRALRVGAVVGVMDEIELMPRALEHLESIGVENIVVCDRASTDGTRELLAEYQRQGRVTVLDMDPLESLNDSGWGTAQLDAAAQTGADWVLFLDADEFWIPASGSIRDSLAVATGDVVRAARFNVPLLADGPAFPELLSPASYADLLLFVRPIPGFRAVLAADRSLSWIQGVPPPKVAIRPGRVTDLQPGHHEAHSIEARSAVWDAADAFIAHLPFTTATRFERKVANIGKTIQAHPEFFDGNRAWHWTRWFAQLEAGTLGEEFERQTLSAEEIATLLAAGSIASAAELFVADPQHGNALQALLAASGTSGPAPLPPPAAGQGGRLRGLVRAGTALGRRRPG